MRVRCAADALPGEACCGEKGKEEETHENENVFLASLVGKFYTPLIAATIAGIMYPLPTVYTHPDPRDCNRVKTTTRHAYLVVI
jgi:hypothetical protein